MFPLLAALQPHSHWLGEDGVLKGAPLCASLPLLSSHFTIDFVAQPALNTEQNNENLPFFLGYVWDFLVVKYLILEAENVIISKKDLGLDNVLSRKTLCLHAREGI